MLCSNITRNADGALLFAGQSVSDLAERYGTPLYLMDEARIRQNCRMYKDAFRLAFGDKAMPLYASKACSFKQMYRIMAEEGMGVDCVSCGEIHTALSAGFPAERIWFHGDGKTDADIRYALDHGVGGFVVDGLEELEALNREAGERGIRQKILLRLTPGIDPHLRGGNTGRVDRKFGTPIDTGPGLKIVRAGALHAANMELETTATWAPCLRRGRVRAGTRRLMLEYMPEIGEKSAMARAAWTSAAGYGVRYTESRQQADIPARIGDLAGVILMRPACRRAGLPVPFIHMEPGRSIVADVRMTALHGRRQAHPWLPRTT